MTFEFKLKNYIKEICRELEFKFIDASIHGHKNKQNIKVIADTEEGITLDQCKKLSQEISDIIFRKDLIFGEYRLDVSSPGLNKNLEEDYEFKRNIGRNLLVTIKDTDTKEKEILGELVEYNTKEVKLKLANELISLHPNEIIKAKIKLKW